MFCACADQFLSSSSPASSLLLLLDDPSPPPPHPRDDDDKTQAAAEIDTFGKYFVFVVSAHLHLHILNFLSPLLQLVHVICHHRAAGKCCCQVNQFVMHVSFSCLFRFVDFFYFTISGFRIDSKLFSPLHGSVP